MDKNGKMTYKDTEVTLINKSGVYSLIMGSKLPKAREFKRWVCSEVLPSIRKTGKYSVSERSGGNAPVVANVEQFYGAIPQHVQAEMGFSGK
ncbi:hypothetical protein AGMMS49975_05340 [Clostridia bacterium]|nr:hypothetical protein AGMMS49975_05340 [Clostridia bacterium]